MLLALPHAHPHFSTRKTFYVKPLRQGISRRGEKMRQKGGETPSSEHEQVYHAASRCQAASLSLTARRLHDRKKTCSVAGKKTGGFASQATTPLRHAASMDALSRLKTGRVIQLVLGQPGENDASQHVAQGTHRHAMAFAPCTL